MSVKFILSLKKLSSINVIQLYLNTLIPKRARMERLGEVEFIQRSIRSFIIASSQRANANRGGFEKRL